MTPSASPTLERLAVAGPPTQTKPVAPLELASLESRHSIWLEFAQPQLQTVVDDLAREFGTPSFVPHLTIVANIDGRSDEVIRKTERMALVLPRFNVRMSGFGTRLERFRYCCLLAEYNRGLENVFSAFGYAFPGLVDDRFRAWPHVSLLYGSPIVRRLCPYPLRLAERYGSSLYRNFGANTVSVWDTTGDVGDWQRLAELPLAN